MQSTITLPSTHAHLTLRRVHDTEVVRQQVRLLTITMPVTGDFAVIVAVMPTSDYVFAFVVSADVRQMLLPSVTMAVSDPLHTLACETAPLEPAGVELLHCLMQEAMA